MDKMKERLDKVKEFIGRFSKKTLIIAAVVAVVVIVGAVVLALALNHKDYVILYTGITDEETTEILAQLSELGISYTSDGAGNIRVPESEADSARAQLAQAGYPKSGFTYDVFTDNAGGMTTDMEKQTYKIYELQNRIGATIRLFDGVEDAKVTIALEDEDQYVLSDSDEEASDSSASVVVIMEDGGSPTAKQATGIQRLVARSVPDMEMDNVSVLDGNGIEISSSDGSTASADAADEIAQIIETQISKKVINVLEPFYGAGNIRVSAKGQVSLEHTLRESTTYETPEKIDENDKTGIVSEETTSVEASGSGVEAAGVVGTETNSEISQYVADADGDNDGYISETETRDYLVNQIKEQGEIDPGTLEDLTVAVSINGSNLGSLDRNTLLDLVGNATGIAAEERASKITIVNAPFYEEEEEGDNTATFLTIVRDYLPFIIIGLLALILLLVFVLRSRKKKVKEEEDLLPEELMEEMEGEPAADGLDLEKLKPEILNMQNERSHELREMVRDFAEENPELSAQMLKNWLHGGGENGGNG